MAADGRTATKTEEQQELEWEKRRRSTTGEELPSRAPRWSAYLARPASKWQEKLKSGVGQPHGPLRGGAEGYWGEATLSASRVEVRRTRVHRRPLTVVMVLGGSAIHAVCVDVQRQRQGERTSGMGGVFRMWAAAWAAREGWENSSWGREWI